MNYNQYIKSRFNKGLNGLTSESKNKTSLVTKFLFFIFGFIAIVWLIIRILPKPSRANYPCMKIAFPVATSFVIYLSGLFTSAYFFKRAGMKFKERKVLVAFSFLLISGIAFTAALMNKNETLSANITTANTFKDPLGPNVPIGEAKGIIPGRVVWVHDPGATNENCTNSSQSDAYYLDKNTSQITTDIMFSAGLKQLTGKETDSSAWEAIFKYFNSQKGKGEIGYSPEETIFIKINAVTAYNGAAPNGDMKSNIPVEFDTSPQAILTLLRQLVNEAKIPQKNIYIGDPMADIWNTLYNKFVTEFPDINYVSRRNVTGRLKITPSSEVGIYYSDKGTVMKDIKTHKFFKEMMDASYLINVPTMKGHRWGGVTFFAKNHFGSNITDGSWQLHKGLMNPDNSGMRYGYNLYRVFVDLMGSKNLGGKTLLYFMDGLWATSYEHQKPQKFVTAPFNNDWCSSFVLSLDPVAIESVCLDILQKEFSKEDLTTSPPRYGYVQWDGVDDYLHQAASSEWWPKDLAYDPDNSGTPLKSLGVHEHWDNPDNMKYSRNLGTGNGIELILLEQNTTTGSQQLKTEIEGIFNLYPNPVTDRAVIRINNILKSPIVANIYSFDGRLEKSVTMNEQEVNAGYNVDLSSLRKGNYIMKIQSYDKSYSGRFIKL
jgi:hypothetical protein